MALFILAMPALVFAQAKTADLLTLKEAGARALENSPAYLQADQTYQQAKLQTKNNRAVFYPSLDVLAIHGPQYYHPDPDLYPDFQSSTQLMLSEHLYDNGESYKKWKIAELLEEQDHVLVMKAKGQVLLSVVESYYNWCDSVLQMQFTRKYADEVERQFNLASAEFHQGVKTRADYLRFKTQAQRSELDLIDAQKAAEKSREDLLALMGLSPESPVQFALLTTPVLPSRKIRTSFTKEDLPEFKVLDLKYRISDLQEALVQRRNLPQFDLSGAWQYGSQDYMNTGETWRDGEGHSWNVLLTMKWNLWDWGVRSRNEQIQALQEKIDQQGLRTQLLSSEQELSHYKTDEARIEERMKIATELQANEKINMKAARQRLSFGTDQLSGSDHGSFQFAGRSVAKVAR
jgi:outer membrane protein TolC